jgi:hypothetical protein
MKKAIFAVLLMIIAFSGCNKKEPIVRKVGAACLEPAKAPLAQAYDSLRNCFRLKPDRRVLLAVADINKFLGGEEKTETNCVFDGKFWYVYLGKHEVGHLSEYPDFPELKQFLSGWTSVVLREHKLKLKNGTAEASVLAGIREDIKGFYSPRLIEALKKIDSQWNQGHHDPELLKAGAEAYAQLTSQVLDHLDLSDRLLARALAIWSLADVLTGADLLREEAMLADVLEFHPHASRLASKLPADDPLRVWLEEDNKRSLAGLEKDSASAEGIYHGLQAIARLRDERAWKEYCADHFAGGGIPLPVLKTGLDLVEFDLNTALPPLVLFQVLSECLGRPPQDNADLNSLIRRFESDWPARAVDYPGPFLDFNAADSFYRSHFYSAIWALAMHDLFALDSLDAAAELRDHLPEEIGGMTADLRRCLAAIIDARNGKENKTELVDIIAGVRSVGGDAIDQVENELGKFLDYGSPEVFQRTREFISRLDARYDHMIIAYRTAKGNLRDLPLREKLLLELKSLFGFRRFFIALESALMENDHAALVRLCTDKGYDPQGRADTLEEMEEREILTKEELNSCYLRLFQDYSENSHVIALVGRHFERSGEYAAGERLFSGWLKSHPDDRGFSGIDARTMLARMCLRRKHYFQGLTVVEPAIASYVARAMETKAQLLAGLGRWHDAEELSAAVVARYPDELRCRLTRAGIFWEQKKYDEAAVVLKTFPRPIDGYTWNHEIAPFFCGIFQNDPQAISKAIQTMMANGMKATDMPYLAMGYDIIGKHKQAFDLMNVVPASGQQAIGNALKSYSYLKQYAGPEKAVNWLKEKVAIGSWIDAGMLFYDSGEYDLLWAADGEPLNSIANEYNWLLRAAAWAKGGRAEGEWRERLLAFFRRPGRIYYHQIGAFLMGLVPQKDLIAMAKSDKQKCEIAYYLGAECEGQGRLDEAARWYRVCTGTELDKNAEYRWAFRTTDTWLYKSMSLARLATEHQPVNMRRGSVK